jgi:rhamnosyltransferase
MVNNGAPRDVPVLSEGFEACVFEVIENKINRGVAAAFNQGWRRLREKQIEWTLFLDQDSIPAENMVLELMNVLVENPSGIRLAAVGAQVQDSDSGQIIPFVRLGRVRGRHPVPFNSEPVETDFLISSGTMVSIETLRQNGGFEERLFIDNVDLEWSFRLRSRGYKLLGVPRARMRHRIGERRRLLGVLSIRWHAAGRLYFMMRNRVVLYRRDYTPIAWIVSDVVHAAAKFAVYSLLIAPRLQNCKMMMKGVWDGARGQYDMSPETL